MFRPVEVGLSTNSTCGPAASLSPLESKNLWLLHDYIGVREIGMLELSRCFIYTSRTVLTEYSREIA